VSPSALSRVIAPPASAMSSESIEAIWLRLVSRMPYQLPRPAFGLFDRNSGRVVRVERAREDQLRTVRVSTGRSGIPVRGEANLPVLLRAPGWRDLQRPGNRVIPVHADVRVVALERDLGLGTREVRPGRVLPRDGAARVLHREQAARGIELQERPYSRSVPVTRERIRVRGPDDHSTGCRSYEMIARRGGPTALLERVYRKRALI
jgi:hypothetical protein